MILYFSGTGNSRYVASRIADLCDDVVVSLNDRIREGNLSPLHSDRPFVVVTPTYAWRIPRIVQQHLERTQLLGDPRIYFVMTCGEDVGNAAAALQDFCAVKRMVFLGLGTVVMPENYIAMFDVPDQQQSAAILQHARPIIEAIGTRIARAQPLPYASGNVLDRFKSGPVNRIFYLTCVRTRPFRVTDQCTGCGKCEAVCPMNNVYLVGNRPRWSVSCTHCMACISQCPRKAIEYGSRSVGKPRYYLPQPNGTQE